MVVDGQIHGGLAEGISIALMEVSRSTRAAASTRLQDYLIPTALECPDFELGETPITPCPTTARARASASPNVGSPPAIVNAVIDALRHARRRPHRHACTGPCLGGDARASRTPQ
jgi:carbon-monoxide dehydrogenase large subunit